MEKTELNKKINEFVKNNTELGNKVKELLAELKKMGTEFSEDYDFIFEVMYYLERVSVKMIMKKLENFNRISSDKSRVKLQFLMSMKLYIKQLGSPMDVYLLSISPMKEIKSTSGTFNISTVVLAYVYEEDGKKIIDPDILTLFGNSKDVYLKIKDLEVNKGYSMNFVERDGKYYLSKEPNPMPIDISLTDEEVENALQESFNELNLINPETNNTKEVLFFKGIVALSTITPKGIIINPSPLNLDDGLPPSPVSFFVNSSKTPIEEGDIFIALGNMRKNTKTDSYTFFVSWFKDLVQHEEELFPDLDSDEDIDEPKQFNMDDTGESSLDEDDEYDTDAE